MTNSQLHAQALMEALDTDGDQRLSLGELGLAKSLDILEAPALVAPLTQAWRMSDLEHRGTLGTKELQGFAQRARSRHAFYTAWASIDASKGVQAMLGALDQDGDRRLHLSDIPLEDFASAVEVASS